MREHLIHTAPEGWPDGYLYRFPNGYGASVTVGYPGYGTSLAVVRYFDLGPDAYNWAGIGPAMELDYSTPITYDVVRTDGLDTPYVRELLDQIKELPGEGS